MRATSSYWVQRPIRGDGRSKEGWSAVLRELNDVRLSNSVSIAFSFGMDAPTYLALLCATGICMYLLG